MSNNNYMPSHMQQYPQQTYPNMPMYPQMNAQGMNMPPQQQQQMPIMNNQMPRVGEQPNLTQFAAQSTQQPMQQQPVAQGVPNQPQAAKTQKPAPQHDDLNDYRGQDDQDQDGLQGGENGEENYEEVRGRRRSKNDVEGRDHRCKYCDKTYLSYPALYTHTKQKHSTGPDGEQRAPPTSGRGRGRPRKNTNQRTDPKSEEYFYYADRRGGPVDPLLHFEELYNLIIKDKYGSLEDYQLYKELKKFSRDDKNSYQRSDDAHLLAQLADKDENRDEDLMPYSPKKLKSDGKTWTQRGWKHDYDNNMNLDENTRNQMKIDETFALYVYKISLKTNPVFYKTILSFLIFFRECLNHIGWTKRLQSDEIDLSKHPDIQHQMKTQQFCLANTAEHAPEICNEFVTVYMEDNRTVFPLDRQDSIDLTINLCHWLFENQFTCSKLTMIS